MRPPNALSRFLADNDLAYMAITTGHTSEHRLDLAWCNDFGIYDRIVALYGEPSTWLYFIVLYPGRPDFAEVFGPRAFGGTLPMFLNGLDEEVVECADIMGHGDPDPAPGERRWAVSKYAPFVSNEDRRGIPPYHLVVMWRLGMFGNPLA